MLHIVPYCWCISIQLAQSITFPKASTSTVWFSLMPKDTFQNTTSCLSLCHRLLGCLKQVTTCLSRASIDCNFHSVITIQCTITIIVHNSTAHYITLHLFPSLPTEHVEFALDVCFQGVNMCKYWSIPVVVPARGGAEVAYIGLYCKTFFIYRTCIRRAPARPVRACFVRSCCAVVVQEHDLRTTPAQCNSKRRLSSYFTLRSSHPALRTSHFTLHTSSHRISSWLFAPHLASSQLFSSHPISSHMSSK